MDKMYNSLWLSFGLMMSMAIRSLFGWPQDPFSGLWLGLAIGVAGFTISIVLPVVARFITKGNFPFVYGWFSAVVIGGVLFLLAEPTTSLVVEMTRLAILTFVGAGMTHFLHNRDYLGGGVK